MTAFVSKTIRLNDFQTYEICELLIQRKKDIELLIQTSKECQKSYDLRLYNELNIIVDLLHKLAYNKVR